MATGRGDAGRRPLVKRPYRKVEDEQGARDGEDDVAERLHPGGAQAEHPTAVSWPRLTHPCSIARRAGRGRGSYRANCLISSISPVRVSHVSPVSSFCSCGPRKSRTASEMSSRLQRIRYRCTATLLTRR